MSKMSTTTPTSATLSSKVASPSTATTRSKSGPIWLGIDPGSRVAGYALLEDLGSRIRVLEYGTLCGKTTAPLEQRLLQITSSLRKVLEQYQPHHLAMESAFVQKNIRSALVLGHARGALMVLCCEFGLTFSEFSPSTVKQAVSGKGNATKERVAWMMQQLLQLKELPQPSDASDALAIAWTGINAHRHAELIARTDRR